MFVRSQSTDSAKSAPDKALACSRVVGRDRNDPKSGLESPNHAANLPGLVLGCIEADWFT